MKINPKMIQRAFILLILFLLAFLAKAEEPVVEKKTFTHHFSVNNNVTAEVYSKYGDVVFEIGNNNEVEYKVEVIVDGKNADDVRNKLNDIDILFSQQNNTVIGRTEYGNRSAKNINVKINYKVKIPASASIGVGSNYVDIYLPKVENSVHISCNYSDVHLQGSLNLLKMKGNYSDLNSSHFVQQLDISGNYNDYVLSKVAVIDASGNYNDLKIDQLLQKGDFSGNYSDFKIRTEGSENVEVEFSGNYLDVNIHSNESTKISAKGNYLSTQLDDDFQITMHQKTFTTTRLEAANAAQPNSTIIVKGNYINLKLK